MKTIQEYQIELEQAIKKLDLPSGKLSNLYEPIKYALSSGGKRIRPVLTLMCADAFGDKSKEAISPALGIETFHNFTLLHDDVMDKSDVRRGRDTVHKKFGENIAILSGDTMLTLATQYISNVPDKNLKAILNIFNNMAIKVYEGQQLDMDFETMPQINPEDYIEMISDKTGALIGAAAQIGGIIGGASEKEAESLYEFGLYTGIAFQIQDDLLDSFGDASTFGKNIGGDINNGKKTYLYVAAMEDETETSKALSDAYSIPPGELRVKTVTRLYQKLGIEEKAKKAVNHYSSLALKSINSLGISEKDKEAFRKFAEKLIGRKK